MLPGLINYESEEEYTVPPPLKRPRLSNNEEAEGDSDEEIDQDDDDQVIRIHTLTDDKEQEHYNDNERQHNNNSNQQWEILVDYCPELRPKLPSDFFTSTLQHDTRSSINTSGNRGLWPTYIHLPVKKKGASNSATHNHHHHHHLEKLMTLTNDDHLHVSITPTKLFQYPTCLEIAHLLFKFTQAKKKRSRESINTEDHDNNGSSSNSNTGDNIRSLNHFQSTSIGVISNYQSDNHTLYMVHYIDTNSAFYRFVHELQSRLKTSDNKNKVDEQQQQQGEEDNRDHYSSSSNGYFELFDDWNVHVTVGKYDTMGNVKQETIDQWVKEAPMSLDPPVEWEWDGTVVMYCGNRKFIWHCIHA